MLAEMTPGHPPRTNAGARYDRISGAYRLIGEPAEHAAREAGVALLRVRAGERVLEVGCGPGRALPLLAAAAGRQGLVHGLDLSMRMLDLARGATGASLGAPVHLTRGDARRLPYLDSVWDVVFMSFTLELFTEDEIRVVVGEARRVLGPRGRLVVVSLARDGRADLATRVYAWLRRRMPGVIDCRPIDVDAALTAGLFRPVRRRLLRIWGLPVDVVVGELGSAEANR
jgi:demethylmenaquinone methyltransferase/2-methoxy-6-polyprenyl-1,4-benzoquinol methylase